MIIDTFFFIVEPVRWIFHLLQCVFKFFLKRIKVNSTQIELSIFIPFPFFFKQTVLTSIDRIYMSNCRIIDMNSKWCRFRFSIVCQNHCTTQHDLVFIAEITLKCL